MRITVEQEKAISRAKEAELQKAVDAHNKNWVTEYAEEFENPSTREITFTSTMRGTKQITIPRDILRIPKR